MMFRTMPCFNPILSFLYDLHGDKVRQNHSNLSLMGCGGIILPETSFTSLNDISQDAFPFIIPFHPGKGPEIDYPDAPVEPEDPDEDPGDEPSDRK